MIKNSPSNAGYSGSVSGWAIRIQIAAGKLSLQTTMTTQISPKKKNVCIYIYTHTHTINLSMSSPNLSVFAVI